MKTVTEYFIHHRIAISKTNITAFTNDVSESISAIHSTTFGDAFDLVLLFSICMGERKFIRRNYIASEATSISTIAIYCRRTERYYILPINLKLGQTLDELLICVWDFGEGGSFQKQVLDIWQYGSHRNSPKKTFFNCICEIILLNLF